MEYYDYGKRLRQSKYGARGAPAGLSPFSFPGWSLELDLSDISTLYQDNAKSTPVNSDGDPIGAIVDKSGSGNDFLQATADNRPLYKTGIQNGQSALLADASNDLLQPASNFVSSFTAATGFIVLRPNRIVGTQTHGWSFHSLAVDHFGLTGGDVFDGFFNNTRPEVITAEVAADTTYIYEAQQDGSNIKVWLNGVSKYDQPGTFTAPSAVKIPEQDGGNAYGGHIMHVLLYNSTLNAIQRQDIRNKLNNKWTVY